MDVMSLKALILDKVHTIHFRKKKKRKNKQTFNLSSLTTSFFVTFFVESCFFADVEQEWNLQDLYRTLTNKDYNWHSL